MEPDARLANVLGDIIGTAQEAYQSAAQADPKVRDRLSYIIGTLKGVLELIRPDDPQVDGVRAKSASGWVKKIIGE